MFLVCGTRRQKSFGSESEALDAAEEVAGKVLSRREYLTTITESRTILICEKRNLILIEVKSEKKN